MKRALSIAFCIFLSAALFAGCAIWRVDTTFTKATPDYVPAKHKKASQVKVFAKNAPESPYEEIGTVRAVGAKNTDTEVLVKALRIRSAKMGADAIMGITFDKQTVSGVRPGHLVCDEFNKCSYLEHDSTIESVPAANATAIVFTGEIKTEERDRD
ncbi:MAG: hypothetical protein WC956_10885 [bacterium]